VGIRFAGRALVRGDLAVIGFCYCVPIDGTPALGFAATIISLPRSRYNLHRLHPAAGHCHLRSLLVGSLRLSIDATPVPAQDRR
jgi:hypothetical protein